jgi:alcohol dehydrogenase, propanol-preferring
MAKIMKASVVHEFGKPLTIEEVPIPTSGSGEVSVRIPEGTCRGLVARDLGAM